MVLKDGLEPAKMGKNEAKKGLSPALIQYWAAGLGFEPR